MTEAGAAGLSGARGGRQLPLGASAGRKGVVLSPFLQGETLCACGCQCAGLYATILPKSGDAAMPVLSDAELRMVAEMLTEMAPSRGAAFHGAAKGAALARAALIAPACK